MKNFLGLGLFAVGAYVLYEVLQGQNFLGNSVPQVPVTSTPNTSTPVVTVPTTPVVTPVVPPPSVSIKQQMFIASGHAPLLNADQWGFYYNALMPPIPPSTFDALFIAPYDGDRSKLYTIDQWISIVQAGAVTTTNLGWIYGNGNGMSGIDVMYGGGGGNGLGWGWEATGPRSGYTPQASWYERSKFYRR